MQVLLKKHPFDDGEFIELPHGYTVHQIVYSVAQPEQYGRVVVEIDGTRIPSEYWHRVRPKPGRRVLVLERCPHGSDAFRLIGAIVIAAAAFWIAGPEGALLTSEAFLAAFGSASTFVAGMVGASIVIGGWYLLNSLFPPELPGDGKKDRTYRVTGSSNRLDPFGPVPVVLGKPRFIPPAVAEHITIETENGTDLMILLLWGYGKVEVEDFWVGETPIEEIGEVQIVNHDGSPGVVPSFQKYKYDIHRSTVNAELNYDRGPVTRRTQTDTKAIAVAINFPEGLVGYSRSTGDSFKLQVDFRIETAPAGSGTWTDHGTFTVRQKSTESFTKIFEITLPDAGQYDVRVTRLTPQKKGERFRDKSVFLELRSYGNKQPVLMPGVALSEIYIPGSEKASGQLDRISAIAKRVALDWDPATSTWIERATNNPASLARWLLQGPANRKPVPDSRIDLNAFQEWAQFCIDNGFKCNYVHRSFSTLRSVLAKVAATGRATVQNWNGIYKPIIEKPRSVPVQMFTAANSRNFQSVMIKAEKPHALRIRLVNEKRLWRDDEIIVYADGYDESNATYYERWDIEGVTDPELAWRHGRFRLGEIYLRRERYSFETDWEGLVAGFGDLVHIAHTRIRVGNFSGRIREVRSDGTNVTGFVLDEEIVVPYGEEHVIRIRKDDGTVEDFDIAPTGMDTNVINVAVPKPPNGVKAGDLFVTGKKEKVTLPALVAAIKPGIEKTIIECIPYDERLYTADTGEIPTFESRVDTAPEEEVPIIVSTKSDAQTTTKTPSGAVLVRIMVTLYAAGTRPSEATSIEIRWRKTDAPDTNWQSTLISRDTLTAWLGNIEIGSTYEIQARYHFTNGRLGKWSSSVVHNVSQEGLVPPNVSTAWIDGTLLKWTEVRDPDVIGYRVAFSEVQGSSLNESETVASLVNGTSLSTDLLPNRPGEILIVAVSSVGVTSKDPTRIAWRPFTAVTGYYKITTIKHSNLGWPGILGGASVVNGQLQPDSDTAWMPNPDGALFPDPNGAAFDAQFKQISYRFDVSESDFNLPFTRKDTDRISVTVQSSGNPTILYRNQANAYDEEPFTDGTWYTDGTGHMAITTDQFLPWPINLYSLSSGETLTIWVLSNDPIQDIEMSWSGLVSTEHVYLTTDITDGKASWTIPSNVRKIISVATFVNSDSEEVVAFTKNDGTSITVTTKDTGGVPVQADVTLRIEYV